MIGDIWSGSEDDARPAGSVAKGYLSVVAFPPGTDFGVLQKLKTAILDAGKTDLKDKSKFGTVYYNYGVIEAIIFTEALRTGHKKFGNRPLTAAEGQWAFEHLDITKERLEELGATGLLAPLKVTPENHRSQTVSAKIQQWDGKQWGGAHRLADRGPGAVREHPLRQGGSLRQGEGHYARRDHQLTMTDAGSDNTGDLMMSEAVAPPASQLPATDWLLEVNDVHAVYGEVILALRGVSLNVAKGAIVALLGANGAGKTTTLKAISNLLGAERGKISQGGIKWQGQSTDRIDPSEIVRKGIVQVLRADMSSPSSPWKRIS